MQGDICGAKSVVLRPGFSRALTELPVLQTGSFAPLRMTPFFLSFWGKTVTVAGGGNRERVCGGGTELKDARQGDTQRRFRRVGKSLALRMTVFFLSFRGKYATAAGGGNRERVCGGEAEL